MDNVCVIPLYSKQNNSLDFLGETIQNSTLDNVVENVASFLKKEASFATTINVAEDQEKYEDNIINKLIPNLILEIQSQFKTRFSPLVLSKLQKSFQKQFLPKESEVVKEDLVKTETREEKNQRKQQKQSLKQMKNSIFKGSNLLSDYHQKEFSKQIRNVIIFNSNKGQRTLVYDQRTLNENLKQYKQNLYEIIYNYCKAHNIEVPTRRSYYNSDNSIYDSAEEVLKIFYKHLLENENRLEQLEKSWEEITLGTSEKDNLLEAVNAFITLNNFDDLIKYTVGNYIQLDSKLDEPINNIEHNGSIDIKYKYNFGRRQSNMQKDFRDVMQNALDTMGNFSKFLIESIPKLDSTENLTQIQFINALLHLKQVLKRLPKNETQYKSALQNLHRRPQENWKIILDRFANESSYKEFIAQGLTLEDINIIKSIQNYLYGKSAKDKKNSLFELEKEVHNIIGYKEVYPLIDSILSTIDSISELNYLETYWDYENNMLSVRIKRKYFNNKQKLDLISGINQEASKPLSLSQKDKYKISYLNGPFTFKIGNNLYSIKPKQKSEFGIFGEELEITVNGESISKHFKDINLNGAQNRKNVLNSTEGLNREFLDLLKYIDSVLTTGLSINNESLQKFYIYNTQSKNGLEDLVLAASRVYLVKDLQRKFEDSIKNKEINPSTGVSYNKRDLRDWLKNNKSLVPIIQFTKEDNRLNRKFFASLLGIPYIKPVQYKDTWIDRLGDAQAILMGESLKAVTKNFDGQNVPNYSPAFLGEDIHEVMARNNENPTTAKLLFSGQYSSAIKNVIIDTDIKTSDGKTKQIKDATEAELQYHFLVTKFLLPFRLTDDKPYRSFISQPTVYSDKSKFVGYEVSLADLKIDLKDDESIIQRIGETLGEYYKKLQNDILNDYSKLFNFSKSVSNFIKDNEREPNLEELNNIKEQAKISNQLSMQEIQSELKSRTLEQLMKDVVEYNEIHDDKIELIQDLHYRNINGKLGLNEIIIYRNQYIMQNLPTILKEESFNYVNTLLNSGVIFDTTTGFKEALNDVATAIGIDISNWIDSNGMLILAKQTTENGTVDIIAGEQLESSEGIEINPILEKYVLLHNLINNNIKEGIIGIDAIHKIKVKPANLGVQERKLLGIDQFETVDLVDALIKIDDKEKRSRNESTLEQLSQIRQKVYKQIRTLESAADNAQLKRTVTIPGTMHYYLQGKLNGILPTLRGAIIQDVYASTYNFEGETKDNLEAHDGGAYLNPITAVWQNNSLQDSEVGDIIKPLWQVEVPTYGAKRLVKYAADTITNAMMKNSELSEISMYHMFKKMTNIRWNGEYSTQQKNLFNQYIYRRNNPNVSFSDIIQSSGSLYYSLGNKTFRINGFGFENGAYYTEEQQVTILPNGSVATVANSKVTYFHYFDNDGNHYKVKEGEQIPNIEGIHTIDSIYELHKTLGGIYSQSYRDGQFVTSDASIQATATLLNMVAEPTARYQKAIQEGKESEILDTQDYYYQPLKYKMVDYLINQSAIKNGTGNINFNTTYQNPENELNDVTNDEPLRYIEMDTQRYGIQQDSEHEADDEELTEMSQVISAIDAGGYYHNEVAELYKAIGHLALEASKVELSKIAQFTRTKDPNTLYDLIGRILIEHLSLNRGQNGIAESLVEGIKKNFGTSTDHTLDTIKIAFSDQSIYSQIISTLASILNKKSVKRKFPGTGQVMAPGYNIVQIWNINGTPCRYEDLIKEALASGITSDYITPDQYNKDIVKKYLARQQQEYASKYTKVIPLKTNGTDYDENFWESQLQYLNPIDIIQCTVDGKVLKPVKLDKIKDYYLFKNSPIQYLLNKGLITEIPKELQVVKRIDIPSNLAPLQYRFVYEDKQGIKHAKNIYDVWAVKDMYFKLEEFKKSLNPSLSEYQKSKQIELEKIRLRNEEQKVLNALEKGIYIDRNGTEFKVLKSISEEAQTLMSNIYRTKFGLKEGESLYDILKEGPKRFLTSPLKMLPNENIYDLALLKSNGEGMLLSFNDGNMESVSGFYKIREKDFQNINEHPVIFQSTEVDDQNNPKEVYIDSYTGQSVQGKTLNGDIIDSYIYALDSNNMEIVPIGIKIDVSKNIEFDGENYIYKDTKKKVSEDLELSTKGGKILQTIQFINKKIVTPKHSTKYTVYNIKQDTIQKLLGHNYLKNIISDLYKQDNYTYIMPARYINVNNLDTIQISLETIKDNTLDKDIKNYLNKFTASLNYISKNETPVGGLVQLKGFNNIFKEYNLKLAENVFNSFKESLYFISSRIPAQSLQSFMKMKVVGFTNSGANMAYVTHWQAWLQGSDYDIDKSYMLGNEFDGNGLYQGWSPLFNYSYMEASKKLPFPTGIEIGMPKQFEKGIPIEEYVQEYKRLNETNDEEGKINLYNKLIRFINTQTPKYSNDLEKNVVLIAKFDDDNMWIRRHLVDIVNGHNTYKNNLDNTEAKLKNFISNKLQRIIQGTSNFIGSHAPITMDYLHEGANASSHKSQEWTTMNPGYIPLMQTQAMVGKKGVGIAANGQKASFIWKYWMTDSINNNNPYKEFVNFKPDFYVSRIEGRFGFSKYGVGSIQDKYIKRLPDINMYNASEEDKLFYEYNENHYIPSDQMSSQMISAATDNAKELILDKINANTDLSKIYMYLITLGFDVKDIVSFMTSPIIDLIARNATQNIYLGTNFKTKDVANYILNSINTILEQDLEEKTPGVSTYSISPRYSFVLDNKIQSLLKDTSEQKLQEMKQDIEEFLKIYELSEEFSYAGRLLGINGGIPTTKEGLIKFKKFIKDMISSRELSFGLKTQNKGKFEKNNVLINEIIPENLQDLVNNIDVDQYLSNKEYRRRVMEYYEIIKGSLNIPAMLEGTDQFQTILEIANILNIVDKDGIVKSKAANLIYDKILEKYPYTDSKYAMQILPILNQILISEFIESNPIIIPVQEGWKYLSKKWEEIPFKENCNFTIGDTTNGLTVDTSISSFHYLMDEYIIPALKNGELFDLKNNAFIQNLIPIIDGAEVRYKINIDMRAAQTNPESKVVLKDIVKDLQELQNYKFGNKSLLDIFMLYSLVVDQNRQGSDRLTDLFASFVTGSQNNLLVDYFKFMGEQEMDNSNFMSKIEGLSVNGFLVSLANQVTSENGHNEPSIKVIDNDGVIRYKFSQGYGKYQDFGDFLPRVFNLESSSDKLLRISTREKYKFGLIYDGFILDILDNLTNFDNPQVWIENFVNQLSSGNINLETDCE